MTYTYSETNRATYEPESNKIRLYVGRVPRDEYEALRAEGWTSTPKQNCQFVASWTPQRRDTAIAYAGTIDDEDMSSAERAADRAERFSGYRDKRTGEALGHADRYDGQPMAHGFQSAARAERAAARHDRIADRASDQWSKAEYWQRRTAGVISHALHKSTPAVRMGRIKELEAAIRKHEKEVYDRTKRYDTWKHCAAMIDPEKQTKFARALAYVGYSWDHYTHPITLKEDCSMWSMLDDKENPISGAQACELWFSCHNEPQADDEWSLHYKLRLAYENQMLEAQGGRAAFVEMVAGGWLGKHQIRKVNKSPATGRVVSVTLKMMGNRWGNESKPGEFYLEAFNVERLPSDVYTPPTAEDIASLKETKAGEKAARPKVDCPLINPTDQDAERLQAIWNVRAKANCESYMQKDFRGSTVRRMTQADYSANSGGTYAKYETVALCGDAKQLSTYYAAKPQTKYCKIRTAWGDGNTSNKADRVIIITDKPQKPLPAKVWEADPLAVQEPVTA